MFVVKEVVTMSYRNKNCLSRLTNISCTVNCQKLGPTYSGLHNQDQWS